ncbi:HPF/RaiA family ribosome-associated protein [Candidatus Berkelbacteria bacterium]|nr:HPF/RaiA family ribosome-associated protein [Candidatus Berkelbacteria bacterium]
MRVTLQLLDKEHKVSRKIQEAAVTQFQKLERYVPDPSHVDLRLEHIHSARKGKTHYVHVSVAVPKEPRTFHAEALAEDFRTALDRLYHKAETHVRRRHEKLVRQQRSSLRKEHIAARLRATLSAPKRLLGSIRRSRRS